MAEESKNFDPEKTVAQPAALDPDATVTLPLAALDPEATVSGPIVPAEPDPEATLTGPIARQASDLEDTDRRPVFDPEATLNPAKPDRLDPEATVRIPTPGKLRKNPFAPVSPPESILANLSALGGLNPLIALANPILGAVPQIRRALKHPDPAGLRANLRDQIESLETSAWSADIPEATASTAVYALCALLDESAAATPWGGSWIDNGLLKDLRGDTGDGEGFFTRLDKISANQSADDPNNADLLEFYYVCLTLGFEGRYRKAEGGREALNKIRSDLYARISRRRPRPDQLSERWRSATAEAAAAPALQVAAKVTAQFSAQHAARASDEVTLPPVKTSAIARLPRRAIWSAVAGVVGATIVFYLLAMRLLDDETKTALDAGPGTRTRAELAAPAPSAPSASSQLAKALEGEPVTVTDGASGIALALHHDHQFPIGAKKPVAELRPLIRKIAAALDKIPGAIVITGHADASPTSSVHYASNAGLSAARARAVAKLMAPELRTPGRLAVEGKGAAEPIASGDSEMDRARNRRVTIAVKPNP